MRKLNKILFIVGILALLAAGAVFSTPSADAETIAEVQSKISDLEKQIAQLSSLLNTSSKQAQTLQNALNQLELTRKKLEADLAVTTKQISKAGITLGQLNQDISATERKIDASSDAIAEGMRQLDQAESQSALEALLSHDSISDAWDYVNAVKTLQAKVKGRFDDLQDLYEQLNAKKELATGEKIKLEKYKKTLADQQKVVAVTKDQKSQLLAQTKNQAAIYNANLAAATAQKEAYEKKLFEYESTLKGVSTGIVPSAKAGVLTWPLDSVRITQYFGKTVSAKRLYVSGTHGGMDFAASIGTPVKAALTGVVKDTEAVKSKAGCQYGKYVLLEHANGMSTIYGHLSLVSVKVGDTVVTGDTIGYSGNTGYATGPHLHFGLYISSGVRIVDSSALGTKNCTGIKTVAAPPSAYLDPMAYLPKL